MDTPLLARMTLRWKCRLLAIGAIAMGGGIWAMHFIAMLAHILPIPVSYDLGITALSIVPAVLAAGVALLAIKRSLSEPLSK